MSRDGTADFLAGFLVGAVVGAAVALLMAPMSGEQTRGMIRDRSQDLMERAEVAAGEARKRAEEAARELQAREKELEDRTRIVLQEQSSKVPGMLEKVKKAVVHSSKPESPELPIEPALPEV
jgi:gas vesicle protein